MKKLFRKETVIGLCVLTALVILFFGIQYLKGVSVFKPSNYYYSVYTDVRGLVASAPVTVNGVKIGQVNDVKIMYKRPGNVLVSYSLDDKIRIPYDSKAKIVSDILGTSSIRMEMAASDVYYQPGDTVPGDEIPAMMDNVGDILPKVSDLVPKVDSLLINLNNVVGNPAIGKTFENLEAATGALHKTVNGLNVTTNELPGVVTEVKNLIGNVNSISEDLKKLSQTLSETQIDSTINNINHLSKNLVEVSEMLGNPNSNLGKLLHDTELYNNLLKASADIDSLLIDMKKNPKRYVTFKIF